MGQAKARKKNERSVKIQGLRRSQYMITDELVQWMKLGILASELKATYENTTDKGWHKALKHATTLCDKVLLERILCCDAKQVKSIKRRKDNTEIKLFSADELRIPKEEGDKQEMVTIAMEDLYDVGDLALNSCLACPQGDCVEGCFYRKVFHRLGFPVARENPCTGECEFVAHAIGEVTSIQPQNQRIDNYFEEDNKI